MTSTEADNDTRRDNDTDITNDKQNKNEQNNKSAMLITCKRIDGPRNPSDQHSPQKGEIHRSILHTILKITIQLIAISVEVMQTLVNIKLVNRVNDH